MVKQLIDSRTRRDDGGMTIDPNSTLNIKENVGNQLNVPYMRVVYMRGETPGD